MIVPILPFRRELRPFFPPEFEFLRPPRAGLPVAHRPPVVSSRGTAAGQCFAFDNLIRRGPHGRRVD
jgi:hypothetical protein